MKVQDLERQLCAVQRHLQMQGKVSQLAVCLNGRLDEITRECEKWVSAVSEDVVGLKKEEGWRREEVLRLKEAQVKRAQNATANR